MCGRYLLDMPGSDLAAHFGARNRFPEFAARFNAAPSQVLPVIVEGHDGSGPVGEEVDGGARPAAGAVPGRELVPMRWGLLPSWAARLDRPFRPLINARGETAASKPSFRSAFARRRCLVPVSGFYEWQPTGGGPKVPHCIRMRDGAPFTLAGLFERWADDQGELVETFAIVTTDANDLVAPLHDRMPVVIGPEDRDAWLCAPPEAAPDLQPLLVPWRSSDMEAFAVSRDLNDVRTDHRGLAQPVAD